MTKIINISSKNCDKLNGILAELEIEKIEYLNVNLNNLINFIINEYEFIKEKYLSTLNKRNVNQKNFMLNHKNYSKIYYLKRRNKK